MEADAENIKLLIPFFKNRYLILKRNGKYF